MKKYIAKSHVAICAIFADGARKHISFTPKTGGGSVYYSNDSREQAAIESHPKCGRLFKVESIDEPVVEKTPVAAFEAEPAVEEANTQEKPEIYVADLNEAKDYLCEKYGFSRTKLRSKASILEGAAAKGIVFVGI